MSKTPEADSLRELKDRGLSDEATLSLAEIALEQLKASMPEHFDENGEPYSRDPIVIPTSSEVTYFKDSQPK